MASARSFPCPVEPDAAVAVASTAAVSAAAPDWDFVASQRWAGIDYTNLIKVCVNIALTALLHYFFRKSEESVRINCIASYTNKLLFYI